MKEVFKRSLGWLLTVLFWLWAIVPKALDWVGRSTLPDDWDQLIDAKVPAFLNWLFNTPWWVPASLAIFLTIWLMYISLPRRAGVNSSVLSRIPIRENSSKPNIRLNIYGFTMNSGGIRKLFLKYTPVLSTEISGIKVLFNMPGRNLSCDIKNFDIPVRLVDGELFELLILHYRDGVGAFWGEDDALTEVVNLGELAKDSADVYMRRSIRNNGPYYCRLVILTSRGDHTLDFTMLVGDNNGLPAIIEPSSHQAFDPNRLIPAVGGFA